MLWRSVWGWVLGGVGTCGGRGGGGAVAWEGARRRSDVSDVCVVLRVERSPQYRAWVRRLWAWWCSLSCALASFGVRFVW